MMVGNLFMHTYSRQKLKVWWCYFTFHISKNGLLCEKLSWAAKFTIVTLDLYYLCFRFVNKIGYMTHPLYNYPLNISEVQFIVINDLIRNAKFCFGLLSELGKGKIIQRVF